MAWIVVDNCGEEYIYEVEPVRNDVIFGYGRWTCGGDFVNLPKGSIKKLIGRDLT